MFGQNRRPQPDAIEVIIGPRASFSGNMQCDASIRIDGAVDGGQIETPANVILTETARVECNIKAQTISIRGVYKGIVHADRVELLAGSQVYGSLNVHSFFMDEGVSLHAELNIQGSGHEERLALPQPTKTGGTIPIVDSTGDLKTDPIVGSTGDLTTEPIVGNAGDLTTDAPA